MGSASGAAISSAIGRPGGKFARKLGDYSDDKLNSMYDRFSRFSGRRGVMGQMFKGQVAAIKAEMDKRANAAQAASGSAGLEGGMGEVTKRLDALESQMADLSGSGDVAATESVSKPIVPEMPVASAPQNTGMIQPAPTFKKPSVFDPAATLAMRSVFGGDEERQRTLKR